MQVSGRRTKKSFIEIKDIELFRKLVNHNFDSIDWTERSMSYTALSAWLSSLFPEKIYPIPARGIDLTIDYLFNYGNKALPKTGKNYVMACQGFMKQTNDILRKNITEDIHLKVLNNFFASNPELKIAEKSAFEQVDWNWLTQDFHLFIYRNILNLHKSKNKSKHPENVDEYFEPTAVEGEGKLARHLRYERDSGLIRKLKLAALKTNPMLYCEVCGFSFVEMYGELGYGFVEAHHKQPLSKTKSTITTKSNIALLCSNCHRMIHKGMSQLENDNIMTIEELKNLVSDMEKGRKLTKFLRRV